MSALRHSRYLRIGAVFSILVILILAVSVASAAVNWNQGFEVNTSGWFQGLDNGSYYGTIARVPSGTNGIVSAEGVAHAVITGTPGEGAPFTRFGSYSSVWPGAWTAEIDVYLDPAWPAGTGFDYSVAASNSSGGYLRDFIFLVAKDTSTGKLLVAASNGSGGAPREDLETLNHVEVTTAGWYTLRHVFYKSSTQLAVDLKLVNSSGTVLFTQTLTDAADTLPGIVGGNRYGWFVYVANGQTLPIDNSRTCLGTQGCDPNVVMVVAPTDGTMVMPTNVCAGGVLSLWTRDWSTCDENSTGATGYVALAAGPATPPAGIGSAQFVTAGPANGPAIFNPFELGLPLDQIFQLTYDTYGASSERPNFFFNVDYDLTDASQVWQGRMVWVPSLPGCATLVNNTWQTLNPLALRDAACWFQTGSPVVDGVAGAPLYPLNGAAGSWNQLMAAYPEAGVHATYGAIGFKVGSGSSAMTVSLDKLVIGYNNGADRFATYDFEPGAALNVSATPNNVCSTSQVKIDFANVPGAYGYEFVVDYNQTLVDALGAFSPALFDPANGSSPGTAWAANCTTTPGQCKFALTLQNPAPAVSGSGTVATINLTAKKAGVFALGIHDVKLTDEDGVAISVTLPPAAIAVDVCGTATISGRVSLQGRVAPIDAGTVTITPRGGGTPVSAPFSAVDGTYSLTVLYPPGGATFVLQAAHQLYLTNKKDMVVSSTAITGQNTRLLGGDADNNAAVEIGDLSCIGGDFGLTGAAISDCGGLGSPDINKDAKVNIQDLSLAGGNYDKVAPQGW